MNIIILYLKMMNSCKVEQFQEKIEQKDQHKAVYYQKVLEDQNQKEYNLLIMIYYKNFMLIIKKNLNGKIKILNQY